MANEHSELAAAASLLSDQREGEQGDRHEIWLRLQAILQQIRATGMPLPDELGRMEQELEEEFGRDAGDVPLGARNAMLLYLLARVVVFVPCQGGVEGIGCRRDECLNCQRGCTDTCRKGETASQADGSEKVIQCR